MVLRTHKYTTSDNDPIFFLIKCNLLRKRTKNQLEKVFYFQELNIVEILSTRLQFESVFKIWSLDKNLLKNMKNKFMFIHNGVPLLNESNVWRVTYIFFILNIQNIWWNKNHIHVLVIFFRASRISIKRNASNWSWGKYQDAVDFNFN